MDEVITRTIAQVNANNFRFKKKFGQNFLIDNNILNKIVEESNIAKDDVVVEIGPGMGALTERLVNKAKNVIAIEIDKDLIPILEKKFEGTDNIEIINEDCLKIDFNDIIRKYNVDNVKVVANLPYYITTPIIMKLLEDYSNIITTITVMIQKEVADRLSAKPNSKDYGAITLACEYYSHIKTVVKVPPSCFVPAPKVHSSVVRMDIKKKVLPKNISDNLFRIIRAGFNQRRKTLINALLNSNVISLKRNDLEAIFTKLGYEYNIRGEKLSLDEFVLLTREIYERSNN